MTLKCVPKTILKKEVVFGISVSPNWKQHPFSVRGYFPIAMACQTSINSLAKDLCTIDRRFKVICPILFVYRRFNSTETRM